MLTTTKSGESIAGHGFAIGWTRNETPANGETITYAQGKSTLGAVLVASTEKGVVAVMADDTGGDLLHRLQDRFPKANLIEGGKEDSRRVSRLVRYIRAPKKGLDFPLDLRGTPFQMKVWKAVLNIPMGKTTTFSEIAKEIGAPKAIRAVGNACAYNNLSMAVPCHRVLRADGALLGTYHWGSERQGALLRREGAMNGEAPAKAAISSKSRSD